MLNQPISNIFLESSNTISKPPRIRVVGIDTPRNYAMYGTPYFPPSAPRRPYAPYIRSELFIFDASSSVEPVYFSDPKMRVESNHCNHIIYHT